MRHIRYIDLMATGEKLNKLCSSLMVCRTLTHFKVLLEISFELSLGGREVLGQWVTVNLIPCHEEPRLVGRL